MQITVMFFQRIAITLGTTAITGTVLWWTNQSGNGLTKTGNTIDAVGTSTEFLFANAIDIASTYVGQTSITPWNNYNCTWTGTEIVTSGGTGLRSAAKGTVLVANSANTIISDGGGNSADGLLLYTNSSDTISWTTSIDGGTF